MAPVPTNVVVAQKFSHVHPNHSLIHQSDDCDYICHVCNTSGTGARFRCHACNLDIHVYCSDFPQELSSFLHTHHPLALVPRMDDRCCDVCRESIDGMFYRCSHCDFDAHPLCTQFPEQLRHVIDVRHKLRLRKLNSAGSCSVCETDCSSLWVYGCDDCRINIHPKCILKPYGEKPAVSTPGTRGIPYGQAPPWTRAHQPHFYGGAGAYGPYHDFGGYGYGYGYGYGGGHSSWEMPNYHLSYNYPPPRPSYGGHTPPSPSPSFWGSVFGGIGGAMFTLVENLAAGAMSDFIFGSVGF